MGLWAYHSNHSFSHWSRSELYCSHSLSHCLPLAPCTLLKARGKTMETYIAERQDKSRSALQKSVEAAFLSWTEELKADQAQFCNEKILLLCCNLTSEYIGMILTPTRFLQILVRIAVVPHCISQSLHFNLKEFKIFEWYNFKHFQTKSIPNVSSFVALRVEKETSKTRAKLVRQLEDIWWSVTISLNWVVEWTYDIFSLLCFFILR